MRLRLVLSALPLAFALLTATSPAQTNFTLSSLPPLAGDVKAIPYFANTHGMYAGYSFTPTNVSRPVVWIGGVALQLPELPGGGSTRITAINQRGEVVGWVGYPPKYHAVQAWIWDAVGGVRELKGLHATAWAGAYDINDDGLVAGFSKNLSGLARVTTWDRAGNATLLGVPSAYVAAIARSVNNAGEVVGYATRSAAPALSGFRWDSVNGFRMLPSPTSGGQTEANGIASSGRAIGTDFTTGQLLTWDGVTPTLRGLGPNGFMSHGMTEIAQGWILADAYTNGGGELFEGSVIRRVADLFPPSLNVNVTAGSFLSDGGVIVGNYSSITANAVGFVLEPEARVELEGGQAAGSIAFRHRAPTHPGELAATLVSLTGMTATLGVGRGATVRLDVDAATSAWLALPGAGFVTLDGNGDATTAALAIQDPSLAGLQAWVCSVVLPGGGATPATSTTVPFILE